MPTTYHCTSCELRLDLGGFHGGPNGGRWLTGLVCRHCGTPHWLEEDLAQALGSPGDPPPAILTYTLQGPLRAQELFLPRAVGTATVMCQQCQAEGPFGSAGPLTDRLDAPEPQRREDPLAPGQDPFKALASMSVATAQARICPRCKCPTLDDEGEYIT